MDRTLVGVFDSQEHARAACQALRDLGIAEDRVHVRSGSGSGTLGGSSGSGSSTGSTSGDDDSDRGRGFFARLFSGSDATDDHAGQYAEAVRRGSHVVVIDSIDESRVDQAVSIMDAHGAIDIDERASQWGARGWQGYDDSAPALSDDELRQEREYTTRSTRTQGSTDTPLTRGTGTGELRGEGTTRIPVVEEELQVGKREVQRGGVRVYTRVTERPIEESITLREERARVERHAVDREATEADLGNAFKEASVEVRETAEQPVVSKTARVVEEVEIGKEVAERTETVRDTVRRSEVEVEDLPASRTTGSERETSRKPTNR